MNALLSQNFQRILRDEHDARMNDQTGSRRGIDIGNLLAGIPPGRSGSGGVTGGGEGGRNSNRLGVGGAGEVLGKEQVPLSATNGGWMAEARREAKEQNGSLTNGDAAHMVNGHAEGAASGDEKSDGTLVSNQTADAETTDAGNLPSDQEVLAWLHRQARGDPARTGYGYGICFHDLALLHGRSADDHGPCMCDLTVCRSCFHELLYFRGRRSSVPDQHMQQNHQHEDGGMEGEGAEGDEGDEGDYDPDRHNATGFNRTKSYPSMAKTPSPLQIRYPDIADIMLVEEHLRTRLHYMASTDVILQYGDEDEFIPPIDYVPINVPPPPPPEPAPAPVEEKQEPAGNANNAGKKGGKKVVQGRKMKGGRVIKGGLPPKLVVNNKKEDGANTPISEVESPARTPVEEKGDPIPPVDVPMRPRLNGNQLPSTWTTQSADDRNWAVKLVYQHLIQVSIAQSSSSIPTNIQEPPASTSDSRLHVALRFPTLRRRFSRSDRNPSSSCLSASSPTLC